MLNPIRIEIQIEQRSLKRLALLVGTIVVLVCGVAFAAPLTFKDGDVLTAAQLTEIASGTVPTGTITAFGGAEPPEGWLLCDGSSVVRASYPALFAAIGTAWGAPSGASFNLPDLRGRFLRGVDSGAARDPDRATRTASQPGGDAGDKVGSTQSDELKSHTHTYEDLTYRQGGYPDPNFGLREFWTGSKDTGATGGAETRPKNANVTFIIKS